MKTCLRCSVCDGRSLVYATVRHAWFTVRYRRCQSCGRTSKTIQKIQSSIDSGESSGLVVVSENQSGKIPSSISPAQLRN